MSGCLPPGRSLRSNFPTGESSFSPGRGSGFTLPSPPRDLSTVNLQDSSKSRSGRFVPASQADNRGRSTATVYGTRRQLLPQLNSLDVRSEQSVTHQPDTLLMEDSFSLGDCQDCLIRLRSYDSDGAFSSSVPVHTLFSPILFPGRMSEASRCTCCGGGAVKASLRYFRPPLIIGSLMARDRRHALGNR